MDREQNTDRTRTPLLPDRANDAPGRIRLLRDRMTQSAAPSSIFVTGCDEPRSFRGIVLTSFYPLREPERGPRLREEASSCRLTSPSTNARYVSSAMAFGRRRSGRTRVPLRIRRLLSRHTREPVGSANASANGPVRASVGFSWMHWGLERSGKSSRHSSLPPRARAISSPALYRPTAGDDADGR